MSLRCSMVAAAAVAATAFACAAPTAEAADPCPNAQYRSGAGATLPDCRAWEQATPADKGGHPPFFGAYGQASTDGNRVLFFSSSDTGNGDALALSSVFASSRTSDWSTVGTDPGAAPVGLGLGNVTPVPSPDGSRVMGLSARKLTADAVEGASNFYVRDPGDRSLTLAATLPGRETVDDFSVAGLGIAAATNDFSHALVSLAPGRVPGDPDPGLYDITGGHVTKVDLDPDGNSVPAASTQISQDGRRITFGTSASLYQRVDAVSTVLVARSHRANTQPDPVAVDQSRGWPTPDGKQVVFSVNDPNAALTNDGVGPFYRWGADGDTLENLTAGVITPWTSAATGFQILGVSPDGRYVWFKYADIDANGSGVKRVAVLNTVAERISVKATFDGDNSSYELFPFSVHLSPDGAKLAANTQANLTGYDQTAPGCVSAPAPCNEEFLFDATASSATPICVSCGPPGTESRGDVGPGTTSAPFIPATGVTDDGRVFFDSPQQLTANDVNAVRDVYEYTPGKGNALLSAGTGGLPSILYSANPTGTDAFFLTAAKLVPQDDDGEPDVYDAREGGGLAGQQIARTTGSTCPTSNCPGAPTAAPALETPGSSLTRQRRPGPTFRVAALSRAARRAAASTGRVRVSVRVGTAGTLSARATARLGRRSVVVGRAHATLRGSGRGTLTVSLSRAARRELSRSRRLALELSVSYSRASEPAIQRFSLVAARPRSSSRGGAR